MARTSTTWKPGTSGNPGGRPKVAREIRELAQTDAKTAYAKVKAIAEKDGGKQQLAAALAILKVAGVALSEDKTPEPQQPQQTPTREMTPEQLEAIAAGGES